MSHSKIATNDEPYCKGVERVILDLGREVMEIKLPGAQLLRKRKDRGNPMSAAIKGLHLTAVIMNNLWKVFHQQVTQSGMTTVLGLLKSGKLILRCAERPGKPDVQLLGERHENPNLVSLTRKISMEPRNPL